MYHNISDYYNQIFPKNQKLHDFILKYAKKDKHAIDLGSGTGRLVFDISLAQMNVLGIDLDDSMILYAKNKYPNLTFMTIDMIEALRNHQRYHLMTCIGNTLPHLDQNQIHTFFKRAKQSLNHDGVLIIQLLNYDLIMTELPKELPLIKTEEFTFVRKYEYFEDYIDFQTELHAKEGIKKESNRIYPYKIKDLVQLFESYQFSYEIYNEKLEVIKDKNHTHYTIILRHQKDGN
jgi:glycine/sarcosine N-methyltransferase